MDFGSHRFRLVCVVTVALGLGVGTLVVADTRTDD